MNYYDIHTHSCVIKPGTLSVVNLSRQFERAASRPACSAGLHPWFLKNVDEDILKLETSLVYETVMAIGECGLDRLCDTNWDLQLHAFRLQAALALKYNLPLVIHCVRAYDQVVAVLSEYKGIKKVAFHGFNRKWKIAEELLSFGYSISFGAAIRTKNSTAAQTFLKMPDDCFLLETDNTDCTIEEIYFAAAHIRNVTVETIALQVESNFNNFFSL